MPRMARLCFTLYTVYKKDAGQASVKVKQGKQVSLDWITVTSYYSPTKTLCRFLLKF